MPELDAGLHHDGDDPLPCAANFAKRAFMDGIGGEHVFRRRRLQMIETLGGTSRGRNLCPDDIDRLRGRRRFRPRGEAGRADCDLVVRQGRGFAFAAHAGVEMQFLVAGRRVGRDHVSCAGHRLRCRKMLPRVGAEMVAAENKARAGQADAFGDAPDEIAEIGRLHAGVAAFLVDLVAGGLDQGRGVVVERLQQGRLDHQPMRRADRGDPDRMPGTALRGQLHKCRGAHGKIPISASSCAKLEVPCIGPRTPTAKAPLALA